MDKPVKESREIPEKRERRSDIQAAGNKLVGLGVPYNSPSNGLEFIEIILPGAFAASLKSGRSAIENRPITFNFRHDEFNEIGSTENNLKLIDSPEGIRFELDILEGTALHLKEAIAAGRIKDMSFEFYCIKDRWEDNTRYVEQGDLIALSAVQSGAYPDANVSLRQGWKIKNDILRKKLRLKG